MIHDLQKASMLKRFSAWLLDLVVLLIIVAGAASLISGITDFDDYSERLEQSYDKYEQAYDIDFQITTEAYEKLTQQQKDAYDAAYEALITDEEALYSYNMVINLTLLMVSLGVLVGYIITEFIIPLIWKNGQTIGKKVFGIGVMRRNGVQIGTVSLFIRTFIGKYTIETMIPVLVVQMLLFNVTGLLGTLLVLCLAVVQVVCLVATKTNSAIHDLLADAVTVDLGSQMIFATEEDLVEYKKQISADQANQSKYF